jgi:uncharacterized protein (TIGR03000 family)
MLWRSQLKSGVLALLALVMVSSGSSWAQGNGDSAGYAFGRYSLGVVPDPAQALPDASGFRDWHSPYFHGYLSYDASPRVPPTYLTSINYPLVYGGYVYPFPVWAHMFGARPRPFSSAPVIYSDYYANTAPPIGTPGAAAMSTNVPANLTTNSAVIKIHVPEDDATISLNGVRMFRTGRVREYTVPNLIPATTYFYDVNGSWMVGNRQVAKQRSVNFHAGDIVDVDFTVPPRTGGTAVLKARPFSD